MCELPTITAHVQCRAVLHSIMIVFSAVHNQADKGLQLLGILLTLLAAIVVYACSTLSNHLLILSLSLLSQLQLALFSTTETMMEGLT